ncbi:bifunctional demethylmenaquinone methyltransferase/2-methoxy-6-polyprenyl-1,4-benzoquinol methylase UbiE [Psittacicella gerlachiana]|uniref:Ubiquinone/menaquinone biosynthesis C-methyltransferase UbiE n=1 Tax=Psittacicella gerlachiana TaxID=2028574 RepID=A0A3A1YCG0_9GAMM|nr:bifunctional demethylmenaquinone methyltransferase/2-methoxy-6-polyprenyl-1,4-benzoquinol methylase UbiE [Psittacicella gerlachiana]RIY34860.1 bifunctional demethylmenaquinone methyltransferase/2-methoxy-6-polyprenyl-1,4-benzoquinol methylase [Psittacicella gerlachiana]
MSKNKYTDFGFKQIPVEQKEQLVAGVFDSVAQKYDLMNDILSFGIHRSWKKHTINCSGAKVGDRILDLAGGTGDFTEKFSKIVGESGEVTLSDINANMLAVGKERLTNQGIVNNVRFVQANAEQLPFPDNYFDVIVISFGLRNVTNKDKALQEMHRVLKVGGRALVLEFSKPTNQLLESIYNVYSFQLLPLIGDIVAKDADSYRYLAESIRKHPDQETLKQMMITAGFQQVGYQNLTGGITALHRGFKF